MEEALLSAAKSPAGGASVIAKLIQKRPKEAGKALAEVGKEVLMLLSRSPRDLADLFESVNKDARVILCAEMPYEALMNMARSPGDWRRVQKSLED